jgi:hypothetical protein
MTFSNHKSGAAGSVHANHALTAHGASARRFRAFVPLWKHADLFGSAALVRAMLVGCVGWASACGSDASTQRDVPKCVPGAAQACSCSASTKGVQECSDDGTFRACECSGDANAKDTNSPTPREAPSTAGDEEGQGAAGGDDSVPSSDKETDDDASSDDKTSGDDNTNADDSASDGKPANDDEAAGSPDTPNENDSASDGKPANDDGAAGSPDASAADAGTECQELPAQFTSSTTLKAGCYHASVSPWFSSLVTLTLSPGVTLVFEKNTGIIMRGGPALVAVGTAEAPIVFTGAEKKRGFWQGVILESPKSDVSDFAYVTIEYAGADPIGASFRVPPAGLITSEAGYISVDNSTIRESAGYGFVFDAYDGTLSTFENNTITRNKLGAGVATLADANALSISSKFSGNDLDYVTVVDADVEYEAVTLPVLDVPYYVPTELTLNAESLTVNAGTRLVFGEDAGLDIREGALLALGSEDDPVVFTGLEAEPGYWRGITLESEGSHTLRNAIVEYAGSGANGANVTSRAQSEDEWGTLLIEGCKLRHSAGYGLVNDGNEINDDYAKVNTFEDNALGDAHEVPWEDDEADG